MNWFSKILASYDYHSFTGFCESLAPSFKYNLTRPILGITTVLPSSTFFLAFFCPAVQAILGIDAGAFIILIVAFITELVSGIIAAHIRAEQFSSLKLSRFSVKVFIYLVLIAIPYHWAQNFTEQHKSVMAAIFDWLQNFLIMQIVFENIVSILENMAVIYGNDKTAWINAIKAKLSGLLQ